MEDQIGTVLYWSNQKEPKQAKIKDEVIRRNLDRICISAAIPLPSNPSRHSQVSHIHIPDYGYFWMSEVEMECIFELYGVDLLEEITAPTLNSLPFRKYDLKQDLSLLELSN